MIKVGVAVASRVCVCPRRRETQSGKSDNGERGERASEQRPAGRLAGQAVRTPITAVVTIARRLVVIHEALLALLIFVGCWASWMKSTRRTKSGRAVSFPKLSQLFWVTFPTAPLTNLGVSVVRPNGHIGEATPARNAPWPVAPHRAVVPSSSGHRSTVLVAAPSRTALLCLR